MGFFEAVKSVLTQYVGFGGRARRSEYWYFTLFNFIVSIILGIVDQAIGSNILASVWSVAVFLPSLAVSMRRLHDIGKSGWFLLLSLIPIVGAIILLVWSCKDSAPGDNQYGPNPKNVY